MRGICDSSAAQNHSDLAPQLLKTIQQGARRAMDQFLSNISLIALCLLSMMTFSDTSPDTKRSCTLQNEADAYDDVTAGGDVIMSASRQEMTSLRGVLLPRSPLPLTPFLTHSKRTYNPQEDLILEPREEMFPARQSRLQSMPWSCEGAKFWRDLGRDHHPRYVREVSCEQKFCWFGHYKCQPKKFIVKVLHRISSPPPECPADLDGKWRLKDVSIALYCECGH